MKSDIIAANRRILIIDDNESIHQDFRKILNPATSGKDALASAAAEIFGNQPEVRVEAAFDIDSAFQGQQGLEKVRQASREHRPYAMAFVDMRMPPGWDGIETINRIWEEDPGLQIVICTAYSDFSLAQIVERLGRTDRLLILKKPFDAMEVLQFADALTEKWRLSQEARAKMDELEERVAERTRELRTGQQQLIEARKMELVGKLAGGIAHDFNSILTAIIGHADLIRQVVPPDGLPFQSAAEIGRSAVRAATLTHQILAFSRKQLLRIERIDIGAAVSALGPALRELAGEAIEVSIVAAAQNPWAMADAGQLEQVLTSLAHNARDAMPHGGELAIEIADATLAAADPRCDGESIPGDYVIISITDTGNGIPDSVKPHLFEPFFTTKAPGQGKGLGLAMCYGVIKQLGGYIGVESRVGHGATFRIYLPRPREARANGTAAAPPASSAAGGNEVVLLVEASGALREMAATVLERQGYTVHKAATGSEAMSHAVGIARVDLLIADANVNQMTGSDLAEWFCSSRPATKVLLTSAFDENGGVVLPAQGAGILRKPYTPGILIRKVREALDAEAPCIATACRDGGVLV